MCAVILEGWKVLFNQKEGWEEGTFQFSFFQSTMFHDTSKHPLKLFAISNISLELSCSLMSFGCESEGNLAKGGKSLKYARVGL